MRKKLIALQEMHGVTTAETSRFLLGQRTCVARCVGGGRGGGRGEGEEGGRRSCSEKKKGSVNSGFFTHCTKQ